MKTKLLGAALALATVCSAQTAVYGHNNKYLLPDRKITPGAVNPAIIADPSGKSVFLDGAEANICAKGFTVEPYKKVTEATKLQICEEYGEKDCSNPAKGAINYLVPLEIGGKDTIDNIWWQPASDYKVKSQFELKLRPMVCSGKFSLSQAQSLMQHNWVVGMWVTQSVEKCDHCTVTTVPTIKLPN